jgi:topoisomerase-4 subunit A
MEIKMGRILKFNSEKADQNIAVLNEQLEQIKNHLSNIVNYTIDWFTNLKEKSGFSKGKRGRFPS